MRVPAARWYADVCRGRGPDQGRGGPAELLGRDAAHDGLQPRRQEGTRGQGGSIAGKALADAGVPGIRRLNSADVCQAEVSRVF